MQILSLILPFAASLCDAALLHSMPAASMASKTVPGHWWAQVGDQVFYAPQSTSLLGLGQNVSDYYYVHGSKAGLSSKMQEHLVGSHDRWHILHLPTGTSMLELSTRTSTGRRSSVSAVTELKSGTILSSGYPAYELAAAYKNPLDADAQKLEKKAVALVGEDTAMDYLKQLVDGGPTRSYSNKAASDQAESFLKQEFEALGLHTCYHTVKGLTNVIGHAPGTQSGGVLVGAHYDSRPFNGKAPGAEDNGSGVASMLAIAKAFMASKAKPKKSVFFIAFAGEEAGCIGSQFFANALQEGDLPRECTPSTSFLQRSAHSKKTFKAADYSAIIMDEIGWLSPKLKIPTVNLESYDSSKEVMDHLRHATQEHNGDKLDVVHNSNPYGSDHMSFLDKGIKGVLTINGDDEAYPHYHQSSDKIQNDDGTFNVDAHFMQMISKMNLGAMMRMAL